MIWRQRDLHGMELSSPKGSRLVLCDNKHGKGGEENEARNKCCLMDCVFVRLSKEQHLWASESIRTLEKRQKFLGGFALRTEWEKNGSGRSRRSCAGQWVLLGHLWFSNVPLDDRRATDPECVSMICHSAIFFSCSCSLLLEGSFAFLPFSFSLCFHICVH